MTYRAVRTPRTIAKSLAIGNPADGFYALKLAKQCNGVIDAVSDAEIVEGIRLLAETEGVFAETAGGVTVGVLKHLVENGAIGPDDVTVALITGNGLKTQEAIDSQTADSFAVKPTITSFEQVLADRGVYVTA